MDKSVVFPVASVQTRPNKLCRACLRILICESERAFGRGSQRATLPSNPQPNNRPLPQRAMLACLYGEGERSNGHPTTKRPVGHVLPYQRRKCSQARFSVGRSSACALVPTLVVTYVAQHSSQPRCSAFHHRLQPHPTNGPDQDTRNTTQIARHGT